MKVLVPNETTVDERRVAATPETVKKMVAAGLEVLVEAGAGDGAHFGPDAYRDAGATVLDSGAAAWGDADLVLKVAPFGEGDEIASLKPGALVIGLLAPAANPDSVRRLAEHKVDSVSMELLPRITRAQSMDALSSQASIAGYKAVLLAAGRLSKYFPLLMTAAGTIPPARVVVMGGGVAGLQALATAKRLGAVVEVSDIRPDVQEQVESLGGRFIDLPELDSGEGEGGYAKEMGPEFLAKQREIVTRHIAVSDVVITTAQVPGKRAPMLVSKEMVEGMRAGAVIVDLAAPQGGNCELSVAGEEIVHQGVTILGPKNLPAEMPADASTLYARNLMALLDELVEEGELKLDPEDEILAASLLTHGGEVVHQPTAELIGEVNV